MPLEGVPRLDGREVDELWVHSSRGAVEERGEGRKPGWGRGCLVTAPPPAEPHSVPLSSRPQCPLPCCTQGHDCQHLYPPSDFTVSTQVFRDMRRSHSLQKVGEPWCLEVGGGAE